MLQPFGIDWKQDLGEQGSFFDLVRAVELDLACRPGDGMANDPTLDLRQEARQGSMLTR